MIRAYHPKLDTDPLQEHVHHFALAQKTVGSRAVAEAFGIPFTRASNLLAALEGAGHVSAIGDDGKRQVIAP